MSKKGGKKDKAARKRNYLNEFESANYEQKIEDSNKKLARLQSRNKELELETERLKAKFKELEDSKADLTSYLEGVLQKKSEEMTELQEKLLALEKLRKKEHEEFRKREETLELEFKTMENNLSAELKLAAGKLNALEDFRLHRIDLMNKFEQQQKEMSEQEIRHKEVLYNTEKQLIISKAKMQNELEKRLVELADSFRAATDLRFADATQRTVRENIALHLELNKLLNYCSALHEQQEEYKERELNSRLQALLHETEAQLALKKMTKQNEAIEYLTLEHQRLVLAIGKAERAKRFIDYRNSQLEELRKDNERTKERIRMLEQHIQLTREGREATMQEVDEEQREFQRLSKLLAQAKNTIKEALHLQAVIADRLEEEEEACESCYVEIKEKLLHSLFNILSEYQESTVQTQEEENLIEPAEDLYEFGNLGLIPATQTSKKDVAIGDKYSSLSQDGEAFETTTADTLPDTTCLCADK